MEIDLRTVILFVVASLGVLVIVLMAGAAMFYAGKLLSRVDEKPIIGNPFLQLFLILAVPAFFILGGFRPLGVIFDMPNGIVRTGLGTIVVAVVGGAFFFLKVSALRVYSFIELLFAAGLTIFTLDRLHNTATPFEVLSLMSSVYLFIRGMDNLKKDVDERARLLPQLRGRLSRNGVNLQSPKSEVK